MLITAMPLSGRTSEISPIACKFWTKTKPKSVRLFNRDDKKTFQYSFCIAKTLRNAKLLLLVIARDLPKHFALLMQGESVQFAVK